jgi:site-specific DNA-methyltransferase (adenine-specific)
VIGGHFAVLRPGGFLVVNITDILCFSDPEMPRIRSENLGRMRADITTELVARTWREHPDFDRNQIAALLGCSEQTVDRRTKGNNARGGKYEPQTRVRVIGGLLEQMGMEAGLYLYDRRIWVKDPAWENSRWHSISYRSVDEAEYLYVFWKPGVTQFNRERLTREEWVQWGSRGVWYIPSVRVNGDHPAKFPLELPRRVIQLLTDPGDTVLDCFVGSGTTAVAAIEEGRHYIGIDNCREYVDAARAACWKAHAHVAQKRLATTGH